MDFIVDLPTDQNCVTVLTIVNYFSKIYMFIPLSSTPAEHVAQAFSQNVVAQYQLPHHTISDRDPRFTGKLW